MTSSTETPLEVEKAEKATAVRIIHGFNDDDWETVRDAFHATGAADDSAFADIGGGDHH